MIKGMLYMGLWLGLGGLSISGNLACPPTSIVGPDPLVVPHLKGAEQCGYVDVGELAERERQREMKKMIVMLSSTGAANKVCRYC